MSQSLCLNCGALKIGAFNECSSCGAEPLEADLAMLLTTHYLTKDELQVVGQAVQVISSLGVDDEIRCYAIAYYLARKWPKLLDYDAGKAPEYVADEVDRLYGEYLASLPGQMSDQIVQGVADRERWLRASGSMQDAEDEWIDEVQFILYSGRQVATAISKLMDEAGEGLGLRRIIRRFQMAIMGKEMAPLLRRADEGIADAQQFARAVQQFCGPIKNGWSGRTKRRAAYLRGAAVRLVEMAQRGRMILRHKAGHERTIPLELVRARQEYRLASEICEKLMGVVAAPEMIAYAPEEDDE